MVSRVTFLLALAAGTAAASDLKALNNNPFSSYGRKRIKGDGLSTDKHMTREKFKVDPESVKALSKDSFDKHVSDFDGVFVAFWSHWGSQDRALFVEWAKLATTFSKLHPEISIAKVDGTKEPELMEKYGVIEYPTLMLVKPDGSVQRYPQDSSRFVEELEPWVLEKMQPPCKPLASVEDVGKWYEATGSVVPITALAYVESGDDPVVEALGRISRSFDGVATAYITSAATFDAVKDEAEKGLSLDGVSSLSSTIAPPAILLRKPFDSRWTALSLADLKGGAADVDVPIQSFLSDNLLPLVTPFVEGQQWALLERAKKIPMLLITGLKYKEASDILKATAEALLGKIQVVHLAPMVPETATMRSFLGEELEREGSTLQAYGYNGLEGQTVFLTASTQLNQQLAMGVLSGAELTAALSAFAHAVLDGSAETFEPTLPNPNGPTLLLYDLVPLPRPRPSLDECHVHKCDVDEEKEYPELYQGYNGKPVKRDHYPRFVSMGKHGENMQDCPLELPGVASSHFYQKYVGGNLPVILRGDTAAAAMGTWDDDWFIDRCLRRDGSPWYSITEMNKVVIRNDRYPLMEAWTFCDFIKNFSKPEWSDKLYTITPLNTDPQVQLTSDLRVPPSMRCPELYESIHETRLWMSSGNTTSSLHFDTHDNLLLQVDGQKTVLLWPSSESKKFYMDFHDRWGLSPLHVDRVDLLQFPLFAHTQNGHRCVTQTGDSVLIPDGYWHQVRSHSTRNVAVTLEFEPHEGLQGLWPNTHWNYYLDTTTAWWEKTQVKQILQRELTRVPLECSQLVDEDQRLDALGCSQENPDQECNFECAPTSCRVEHISSATNAKNDLGRPKLVGEGLFRAEDPRAALVPGFIAPTIKSGRNKPRS